MDMVALFYLQLCGHIRLIYHFLCQYRMCAGIMELSNALIYGNRLRCGSSEVADAKLKLSCSKPVTLWLQEVEYILHLNMFNFCTQFFWQHDFSFSDSECKQASHLCKYRLVDFLILWEMS